MITVKKLKELLNELPDDAKCYAYEGEDNGITIFHNGKNVFQSKKSWWIRASENTQKDTYTEGFNQGDK